MWAKCPLRQPCLVPQPPTNHLQFIPSSNPTLTQWLLIIRASVTIRRCMAYKNHSNHSSPSTSWATPTGTNVRPDSCAHPHEPQRRLLTNSMPSLPSTLLSSPSSSTSIAVGADSSTWIKMKLCLTLQVYHLPKLASALTFFVDIPNHMCSPVRRPILV